MAMHLGRPDLHFQRAAVLGHHGGVQRTVEVALRMRNVVVELAVDRLPEGMNNPQRGIAVTQVGDDDAQRPHIVDFLEVQILGAHLVPDAVDMLRPAINLRRNTGLAHFVLQARGRRFDEVLALGALLVQLLCDSLVGRRLDEAEREILDLPLHLPDAETVGEWCVNFQAFSRQIAARERIVVGEPAQRLRARCQPQHDDTDIVGHRQQHLAQNFRLRLGFGGSLHRCFGERPQPLEPVQVVDQGRARRAELRRELARCLRQEVSGGKQNCRQA